MPQFPPGNPTPRRRRDDRVLSLFQNADPQARASLLRIATEVAEPDFGPAAAEREVPSADLADAARPEGWVQLWRRVHLPEQLIVFYDDLAEAIGETEICNTVARHAVRIVGAYQAMVLLPHADTAGTLHLAGWWSNGEPPRAAVVRDEIARSAPEVINLAGTEADGAAEVGLLPLSSAPNVASFATMPVGEQGLLLLSERRQSRVFTEDDRKILRSLASHAGRALARGRALEEARSLAMVDPLTGLANRRHMDVFLQHAWAAAERGEGLTVMLFDLDDFKAINDRHGHSTGDDVLRVVGEVLRSEVRGSDAAVRYGGDEFLVILSRAGADAARLLYERVQRRLEGWVGVTAGIASYHPSYAAPQELIKAADADLYVRKQARSDFALPAGDSV